MESFDLSTTQILLLVLAALFAGFIDTLVGGGGLITIPALLAVGVPPIHALGTNKLQAVIGSGTASLTLLRKGEIKFSAVKMLMISAFIGALFGTVLVQYFNAQVLNVLIPIVILLIALYFIFAPKQSLTEQDPKISSKAYRSGPIPSIGFYDGMFGPGTGSFFVLAGVSLRGQSIVQSTVMAKPLNFATNAASLIVFILYGHLLWFVGGLMMIGQFLGASLGARMLLRVDPSMLRYLVIAVCLAMLISWGVS